MLFRNRNGALALILKACQDPRRAIRALAWRVRQYTPAEILRRRRISVQRKLTDEILAVCARGGASLFKGSVLVDATWDNPNYWARYALMARALGLTAGQQTAVLGHRKTKECIATLERFGVRNVVKFNDLMGHGANRRREAVRLLAQCQTPEDILRWKLPLEVPPDLVYDWFLKAQRTAAVDLGDPRLVDYMAEALGCIEAGARLLDRGDFKLYLISHAVGLRGISAWIALKQSIPVVLLYGNYGVARFAKMTRPEHLFDNTDRPGPGDLANLSGEKAAAFVVMGQRYLDKRQSGRTDDLGAIYAFQKSTERLDRRGLYERFGWDPAKPVIGVYASNWFDYPHALGMRRYRDFLEWLEVTLKIAGNNRRVNWLFRPHPADDWYGGVTLKDLMPQSTLSHVQLAAKGWNNTALMDCLDGIVTYHGTVGIEFAAMGKPVLLSDIGWYHDFGFAKWPTSRAEYESMLNTEWWRDVDSAEAQHRARLFAGWYFCAPEWQGHFVFQDDSVQEAIYERLPDLFRQNASTMEKETILMRQWFDSGHRFYNTFKMLRAPESKAVETAA